MNKGYQKVKVRVYVGMLATTFFFVPTASAMFVGVNYGQHDLNGVTEFVQPSLNRVQVAQHAAGLQWTGNPQIVGLNQ